MFYQIKKALDKQLRDFSQKNPKLKLIHSLSPLLGQKIKEFINRPGKRIRPALFVIGYKGYKNRLAPGLYQSALSFELLHAFMLIHDDIIDKAATRRKKPSLHASFDRYLSKKKPVKFNGSDLAIVTGDIIFALAVDAFLAIKEKPALKEKALQSLVKAAAFTGTGEFLELISGIQHLNCLKKSQIYQIYDYKTAFYTFSCPLLTGAELAGASKNQISLLNQYGTQLGRAFQIKDDILGLFASEKETGKSALSDLQEAKKTLLIFYAYKKSSKTAKNTIERLFKQESVTVKDLTLIRQIVLDSKALTLAQRDIAGMLAESFRILTKLKMKPACKEALENYSKPLFDKNNYLSGQGK